MAARRTGADPAPADGARRGADPGPDEDEVASAADLAERVHAEELTLEAELAEIELLVQQARTEAVRHEAKRAAAAERLAALASSGSPTEVAEVSKQLLTLTRRATVMQAQVDVLEGKAKVLQRYRDATSRIAGQLESLADEEAEDTADDESAEGEAGDGAAPGAPGSAAAAATAAAAAAGTPRPEAARKGRRTSRRGAAPTDEPDGMTLPPAVSRMVLAAQEDLRREIAREMHDGPAQSLTNIVLQAQIVERLLTRDPQSAVAEVRQLVAMVQQTLDATKSFIFDVRPMVLDDLGLLPTIRRAAQERSRRTRIPVDLESVGADRRLTMELESGLFRIVDEVLAGFLAGRPDRVAIRMDWTDGLETTVAAVRHDAVPAPAGAPSAAAVRDEASRAESSRSRGRGKAPAAEQPEAMPAALAAMIEDRESAATAARRAVGALPASVRREIRSRAVTLGVDLEIAADGLEVRLVVGPVSGAR